MHKFEQRYAQECRRFRDDVKLILAVIVIAGFFWWAMKVGLDRQERVPGRGMYSNQALEIMRP